MEHYKHVEKINSILINLKEKRGAPPVSGKIQTPRTIQGNKIQIKKRGRVQHRLIPLIKKKLESIQRKKETNTKQKKIENE